MFDTTIDIKFEDELNWSETIFIPPCSTVTISTSFGLEISTKTYFKPGDEPVAHCKYVPGSTIYAYCNKHSLWKKDVE